MTKEEIEEEATNYIKTLVAMEAAGIITYSVRKSLTGKVKGWVYDRAKDINAVVIQA